MTLRRRAFISSFVILSLCLFLAPGARAGIGGPYGNYSMAYTGSEALTLYVIPDGGGETFDNAFLPDGNREDATITLYIEDAGGNPVADFPREDMWLESRDGAMVACPGGTIADSNTDAAGMTRWSTPLRAGGYSQALTEVRVNGSPLELTVGVKLSFNSPDINGDRTVNLTDVQIFTADFFGAYDFRSDFRRDGVINLSDVAELSYALGASCP